MIFLVFIYTFLTTMAFIPVTAVVVVGLKLYNNSKVKYINLGIIGMIGIIKKGSRSHFITGIPITPIGIFGGAVFKDSGRQYVVLSPFATAFTRWHEIGHIRLGHIKEENIERLGSLEFEIKADRYALKHTCRIVGLLTLTLLFITYPYRDIAVRIKHVAKAKDVPWFKFK